MSLRLDYEKALGEFLNKPGTQNAEILMVHAVMAWRAGYIGDATFVRNVLEPVRHYLLAGNEPR